MKKLIIRNGFSTVVAVTSLWSLPLLISCDEKSGDTGTSSTTTPRKAKISFQDDRGVKIELAPTEKTFVVAMATWCPFCKVLKEALKDPNLVNATKSLDIVFVFENEWPTIEKMLIKEVGASEAKARLDEFKLSNNSEMFDPTFLGDLGHPAYFRSTESPKFDEGVPSAFNLKTLKFDTHPIQWLSEYFPVSKKVASDAWKKAEAKISSEN
jgi:thiol-disulfide isomerase/thioredoxin